MTDLATITFTFFSIGSPIDGVWVGLIASGIAAPIVFKALLKIRSQQTISEYVPEHQSKQGTPTMGGIIVLVGLIVGSLYYYDWPIGLPAPWLIIIFGFGAVGFLDDFVVPKLMPGRRGLGWIPKLCLQFAVAFPAAWLSGFTWLDVFWAGFVIVAFCNAFNFADGMDGLAGGIGVLFALGLAAFGVLWDLPASHVGQCMVLAGALMPFLLLNAPPAKVFMGDIGSLPIGATLGWLSLKSCSFQYGSGTVDPLRIAPLVVLSFVLLAELLPVPLQILSVKLRKKRLFPMTPIHHAFQAAGWPETRVVALFHLVQAVAAFLAIKIAMEGLGSKWDVLK